MTVLFDGEMPVQYRYIYLHPANDDQPDGFGRDGQLNGLCGASIPGALSMTTGLHSGEVPLRVEALDAEPEVGDRWEEVVEVSFSSDVTDLTLASFEHFEPVALPAPGTYRVRFSASGMDEASETDWRDAGEPVIDRYLLQLWPAPAAPDRILRQTSRSAAYWHGSTSQ